MWKPTGKQKLFNKIICQFIYLFVDIVIVIMDWLTIMKNYENNKKEVYI